MKRLALSYLIWSAASYADTTLPYITFQNNTPKGGSNSSALFSLNQDGAEQLIGSLEYPLLSDMSAGLTVATYIPVAPSDSGMGTETNPITWKYQFNGFRDVAFRGTYCSSCAGGYKPPISVNSSEMVIPYNPMGGAYGVVGLTLSSSSFNYLLNLGIGQTINATTSPYKEGSSKAASVQSNALQKLGEYKLDNSARLTFAVDPITGAVVIKSGITGQRCTSYQYIGLKGQLCEVMKYTYQGSAVSSYGGSLSLTVSKINALLYAFQSKGLSVYMTFDEKLWYTLSNASIGSPAVFADSFLQQPAKSGGNASLKMFFPDDFIKAVALQGEASNLTEIATLCLTKPKAQVGGDFCFYPGSGVNIIPATKGIEIKPDNPDYKLDPTGFGGSGKGNIGDATPITIPYTVYATSEDPAVAVNIRVTGPGRAFKGVDYCRFTGTGAAAAIQVPIPGDVLIGNSRKRSAHNCKGNLIPVPPPATTPGEWTKQASSLSDRVFVWKTPVIMLFPMNDPVSTKTFDGQYWDGVVSAEGTIEVSASWN